MIIEGAYDISRFAVDTQGEIERLNAQIDLFWSQELDLYQRLGLEDGMSVLDCGCGPGYLLGKLLVLFPSLECTGIEIDGQLVEVAKRLAAAKARNRWTILQQSVTALDLPDDTFDFVITRLVLEHLPNPLQALKEVLRVLKVGGKAVFIDNDFDLHEHTWPHSPALDELYAAYRRARRSEGGNPCIGRELPLLMKRAGYRSVDVHLLAAHNQIVGDTAFLKAEGAGIPAQLVKTGHLPSESLDRIAGQWNSVLRERDHAIFRMLFAVAGEKTIGSGINAVPDLNTRFARFAHGRPEEKDPLLKLESFSVGEIARFIQRTLAAEMDIPPDLIPVTEPLVRAGVDSIAAVSLCNKLQGRLGVSLTIAEVLGGSSIDELAGQVVSSFRSSETPRQSDRISRRVQ